MIKIDQKITVHGECKHGLIKKIKRNRRKIGNTIPVVRSTFTTNFPISPVKSKLSFSCTRLYRGNKRVFLESCKIQEPNNNVF